MRWRTTSAGWYWRAWASTLRMALAHHAPASVASSKPNSPAGTVQSRAGAAPAGRILDTPLAAFDELIQLAPNDAHVYFHRAQVYRARHQVAAGCIADRAHGVPLELDPVPSRRRKPALQQLRRLAGPTRRELASDLKQRVVPTQVATDRETLAPRGTGS